jgi:hypothetical protein
MITPSVIDEVTLWFSAAILDGPAHETDRMVIDRVAGETNRRPLAEIIDEMQDEHREDAGEFGLGQEAFLLASVLLPAVHGLVSAFAAKFFEGAASASGKAAVEALKDKVAKSFTPDADPVAAQAAIADLDQRLARRARELGQPGSSYQDVLHYLRNNPKILL